MVQLGLTHGLVALARNQAHRVLGGAFRGGHSTAAWSLESRDRHCRQILDTLGPSLGDVTDQVGLEIGPRDNLGVCALLMQRGCRRMYALEKFTHPTEIPAGVQVLHQRIEELQAPESL